MGKSCLWRPTKGSMTFSKFKIDVGYQKAWDIIGVASDGKFIEKYKETLSFDREGFPTYESLFNNSYIQNQVIGQSGVAKIKSKQFKSVEDTLANYGNLLEQALRYNRENANGDFVAVVDYSKEGIKINLLPKDSNSIDKFKKQYAVYKLNDRISYLLRELGVTPEMLTAIETRAGRAGSTQFLSAMGIAQSAVALIKIANNMEGAEALSEEFSHLMIDALRDNPLVSRALATLSQNMESVAEILGDEFDETMEFHDGNVELVAEEALGQILRDKLVENTLLKIGDNYEVAPTVEVPTKVQGIISRLVNFIKNMFKKISYNDAVNAVNEANTMMTTLADSILSEKIKVQRERINSGNRNVVFNALSDRLERNIEVLKEAIKTETKRGVLLHEDSASGRKKIAAIQEYIDDKNKSALGVMIYAHKGLRSLQNAFNNLNSIDLLPFEDKVRTLRASKTILQSYGSFITAFTDILNGEELEDDNLFEGKFTIKTPSGDVEIEAAELLKDLRDLTGRIAAKYTKVATPIFVKFLEESLGKETVELLLKGNGNASQIEELLTHSAHDISFSDLWIDAMRDSANPILQAFDKVVKNANGRARLRAIDMFKEIQAIRQMAEAEGITDFDFMFEKDKNGHKSGNYVNKSYNYAEYLRARHEFEKSLDEKYGENPTGKKLKEKNAARQEWLNKYTVFNTKLQRVPKGTEFPPAKLTAAQQKVLKAFLDYKTKLDKLYPENRVDKYKAIQARKDGIQRVMDGGLNPVTIFNNWKENLASTFLDRSDDDAIFGESTRGLTNFDGTEYMRLPVLYTNRLRNPDELSDDVFGSLYAYAAAATKYDELSKVVAPLEIGRDIIEGKVDKEKRLKVEQTSGQKHVVEYINKFGQKIKRPAIMSNEPNLYKKLDIFMETQIYQRYLKDEGTFEVMGAKLKTSKVTSRLLQMGSVAQLGFNFLANLANATTGVAMQNIEAYAGQFFKASELASADKEYGLLVPAFLKESYARSKTNKLSLFDELFDVRQDFSNAKHHTERSNLLRRIFGKNIQFIGQEAGDHWLYNRTAIAMVKHIKVKYKGKDTTLWDVLAIRDHPGTKVKEMYIPDGVVDKFGRGFDKARIDAISRKIAGVNHRLFGIYNEEDMNAANRVSLGRILMQYRKWMKPQFNARFEKRRTDLDLGEEVEGYYRTFYNQAKEVIQELKRGEFQYTVWKDNLSDLEKANLKRSMIELVQFAALSLVVFFCLGTDDDEDEAYILKLARYAGNRLIHETGNLAPSYTMLSELQKTVSNPAALIGVIGDVSTFIGCVVNPFRWNDELQSGDYEGHSHLYRSFMKLPLAPQSYYRQFNRIYNNLDRSIQYYTNPSY